MEFKYFSATNSNNDAAGAQLAAPAESEEGALTEDE